MAASNNYSGVNVVYSRPAAGQQPTPPLCGADDCGQPVQLPSNSYCLQCAQWFCSGCLKEHNRFRLFKGHTLTDRAASDSSQQTATDPEQRDEPAADEYRKCPSHAPVSEKYFCLRCGTPVCSECLAEEHEGHAKCKIEQRVEGSRGDLKKRISEIEEAVKAELDHRQQLRKDLSDLQEERREINSQIKEGREEVTQQRRRVEAKFNSVMQLNKQTTQNFAAVVQQAVQESDRRIAALNDSLAQIEAVEKKLVAATQSKRLELLQVLPVVGDVRRRHVAAPTLLRDLQDTKDGGNQTSDVRHVKHVGCQVTATCNNHGTVRFRRRVADIRPDTGYFSDESRVGHVPWSLRVWRSSTGDLGVLLESDRHKTLGDDFEVDVEFSGRILHPTKPEKHVSRGKRRGTLTRTNGAEGWMWASNRFCGWEDLRRGGHIADGFLTVEMVVHVKKIHIRMKFDS